MKHTNIKLKAALLAAAAMPLSAAAQETAVQSTGTYFSNPLFNTLLVVIIVLLIMVLAMAGALKNVIGSDLFIEKLKKEKEQEAPNNKRFTGTLLLLMALSGLAYGQQQAGKVLADDRIGGLDQFTFYTLLVIIAIELLALTLLFNTFRNVIGSKPANAAAASAKPKAKPILDRLNDTVEIEQEESILLDHNYDGIKELDNNLPPWWKYGFYLTIFVGVVYLINYHVTGTAPLQKEEYAISVKKAEAEIAEYMKNSASNVDESTVKLLTEAGDLASGKDLFIANCAACHGRLGEGTVGPNLTDDYWLHSGSIGAIFKTIKYGWPDKGMKAWKEDFSPMQIAQLASFIKSLRGTNPPKAKDQQGELYTEQAAAPSDSTATTTDSTKIIADTTSVSKN